MSAAGYENMQIAAKRVELTDVRHVEISMQRIRLEEAIAQLEVEKKAAVDAFKEQISKKDAEAKHLRNILVQGYELEDVPVDVMYDMPTKGMKTLVDARTGENVRQEPMTQEDRQRSLYSKT